MVNLRSEEEKIIKDVTNRFTLEKQTKAIKDRIYWDIKNLFEQEEEWSKTSKSK